ncbi:MAG: hypothetical protein HYR60_22105 [Acidobacteria bacterium]|nr:hypothetical protein [Acidobacteriota bacterium]
MANPIVNKSVSQIVTPQRDLGLDKIDKQVDKTGASKFDQVRDKKLQETQSASAVELPPEITKVNATEQRKLEGDLRKRLAANRTGSPQDMFRVDMKNTRTSLDNLRGRVAQLPKSSAMEPVRARLAKIESQFDNSGKFLNSLPNKSLDNPKELLQVQVQMYQMTQNIEIMSKVVEQVNTGVKSILQTQV